MHYGLSALEQPGHNDLLDAAVNAPGTDLADQQLLQDATAAPTLVMMSISLSSVLSFAEYLDLSKTCRHHNRHARQEDTGIDTGSDLSTVGQLHTVTQWLSKVGRKGITFCPAKL